MEFELTKERYEYIESRVKAFNESTNDWHSVDVNDVLYSLLYNEQANNESRFMVLNDWDEGEPNDPYWDKVNNCHSTSTFLMQMFRDCSEWQKRKEHGI